MDAKHSPLPWRVFDAAPGLHFPGIDASDHFTVVLWGDEDSTDDAGVRGNTTEDARANADFIVRCVNSHGDLLAALKRSLDWLASYPGGGASAAYEQARAAIAKAEGKH